MGVLGRISGWEQQKEAHNAVLASDLVQRATPHTKRRVVDALVQIHHGAGFYQNQPAEKILAILSDLARIEQMNFVAIACIHAGIPSSVQGVEFAHVPNPYQADNASSVSRIGVVRTDLSRRAGRALSWPGNDEKINFLSWASSAEERTLPRHRGFGQKRNYSEDIPANANLNFDAATNLAHGYLLMEIIDREEVRKSVVFFGSKFDLPSNYDLAIATALAFFESPHLVDRLDSAQMMARLTALEWFKEGNLSSELLRMFADRLYEIYKP